MQFSIVKIDYHEVRKYTEKPEADSPTFSKDICAFLMADIVERLGEKAEKRKMEKDNTCGLMFRFYNPIREERASHIILYADGRDVYAMVSGAGSQMIERYIEKSWGMHLLADLLKCAGNCDGKGGKPGMSGKAAGILMRDSVLLNGAVTLDSMERMIRELKEAGQNPGSTPWGNLVSIRKEEIRPSELVSEMIEGLICGKVNDFQLVDVDDLKGESAAAKYQITKDTGEIYYSSPEPITLEMIFDAFAMDRTKISKGFLNTVLKKWTISAFDSDGEELLSPVPLYRLLRGTVRVGKEQKVYYIFKGRWYRAGT